MAARSARNALVLAKIEPTEGQDSNPTPDADAILANQFTITPQADIVESNEFTGSLDAGEPIIGGTPIQLGIEVYLKGSGAAGTPPEVEPLLLACGFDATVVPTTSVTYDLISTGIPSVTIYFFQDGIRWTFTGCRGSLALTATTRQLAAYQLTMTGRFGTKTDNVPSPAPVFDSARPQAWRDGVFTIGGQAAALQQFTVNQQSTVALPDNPNDVEGFDPPQITARNIQGTMNPLETLVATRDIFDDFRTGTTRALVATVGTVAGNIGTINVPAAKYRQVTPGERDQLAIEDVNFQAVSIDDGLQFVFT